MRNARLSQRYRSRPKPSAILRRVTDFSEGPTASIARVNQSDVLGLPDSEDEDNPSIRVYQLTQRNFSEDFVTIKDSVGPQRRYWRCVSDANIVQPSGMDNDVTQPFRLQHSRYTDWRCPSFCSEMYSQRNDLKAHTAQTCTFPSYVVRSWTVAGLE